MLIGELAKLVGLPIDTIRFYEKRDLLVDGQHFIRHGNKYRHYNEAAVARLHLIKNGQAAGLTLNEMSRSIAAWETEALSAQQKREFFQRKIQEIEARIGELEQMKAYLHCKLQALS